MNQRTPLGRRLEKARKRHAGLSARQLALNADLSPGMVSLIERGDRGGSIRATTIDALARALGVSPAWLLNGDGDGPDADDAKRGAA